MFEVLVGRRLSECVGSADTWEGLRVLFYLRNVIAHGRMASAEHTLVDSTSGSEQWEEKFKGGYAKTLEYLRKRGIESGKFGEHDVETLLFKAAVADHFWQLTQDAVKAIRAAVGAELDRADAIRISRKPEPAPPSNGA